MTRALTEGGLCFAFDDDWTVLKWDELRERRIETKHQLTTDQLVDEVVGKVRDTLAGARRQRWLSGWSAMASRPSRR